MIALMNLPKLGPSVRVGDQVFDAIQDAIMRGDLTGGQRLQIRQVADQLGISVMPVREAMKRLEEAGLVESQPYRGAVVRTFSAEELLNLYAVRRLLEVEAARLGAAASTPDDLARLRTLRIEMEDSLVAGQVAEYLDKDEEFLAVIYAGSGNPFLVENIRRLWRRCRTYKIFGAKQEMQSGNLPELLRHQDRLLEATEIRDAGLAARATDESLDAATRRIRVALSEDQVVDGAVRASSPFGSA